jgi:hypothetical protein
MLLASGVAQAAEKKKAAPAEQPEVEPAAVALVDRAGDFLRAQESFSFTARSTYEVVQQDGSKLEFGATRHYLVRRPDGVRVEFQPRSGEDRLILFDGNHLTVVQPRAKVYAQLRFQQHRDIDEAIELLRDVLDVPIPLGDLLRADPRPEIVGSLKDAYRVGLERIDGAECDHVALRNEHRDVQFWIQRGDAPLLRRVVITYRDEPGAPSFTASLDDWAFGVAAPDDLFLYTPPPDFERIRFAVPDAAKPAASRRAPEAP